MPSFRTIFLLVATTLATLALATPVVSTEGVGLIARNLVEDGFAGALDSVGDLLSDIGRLVGADLLPEAGDFGAVRTVHVRELPNGLICSLSNAFPFIFTPNFKWVGQSRIGVVRSTTS
ncbi:hypothetical protein E4T56_gene13512 [Termitomyces sp. T112]|nr:hypothetical protein E4T56_gene13512 [Termitomyces sp. T112]